MAREKFGTNVRPPSSPPPHSQSLVREPHADFALFFFVAWLGVCYRCDAEPGALADYILALLKHYAAENELRVELGTNLEEFLEKGAPFIRSSLSHISNHSSDLSPSPQRRNILSTFCSTPFDQNPTSLIIPLLHPHRLRRIIIPTPHLPIQITAEYRYHYPP